MPEDARSPLELLEALTVEEVAIAPDFRHLEIYTMRGLLTLLWHGPVDAHDVLVTCGGGMGSLLGPAGGLYHDLGVTLAARGVGTIRVGYRKPNDLARCVHDVAAAADLAGRRGARSFVVMGHSFGGAVAIQVGAVLGTQILATLIAVYGVFMTPLGWGWALFVWGYALAWFLVNDRVKLLAYWIFDAVKSGSSSAGTHGILPAPSRV